MGLLEKQCTRIEFRVYGKEIHRSYDRVQQYCKIGKFIVKSAEFGVKGLYLNKWNENSEKLDLFAYTKLKPIEITK